MESKIFSKEYPSKEVADIDMEEMEKNGYYWVTGWYTIDGFCYEYLKIEK